MYYGKELHLNGFVIKRFKRKMPDGEFYYSTIVKLEEGLKIRPLFLHRQDHIILQTAGIYRLRKLFLQTNHLLPIIAYYPDPVTKWFCEGLQKVTDSGEVLLNAGSRLNYALRKAIEKGSLEVKNKRVICSDSNLQLAIDKLSELGNLHLNLKEMLLGSTTDQFHSWKQIVPVSQNLGFPSQYKYTYDFLFNGIFFLMESTDMESYHSYFGQPYGILISDGKVLLPPLFKRGAILYSNDGIELKRISINDVKISVGKKKFVPSFNSEVFTKDYGIKSPNRDREFHLAIVNNKVMSYREGGSIRIPDAGFVLAMGKKAFNSLNLNEKVTYNLSKEMRNFQWGVQVGPVLLDNGEKLTSFGNETFHEEIPPTVFTFDWDQRPAARIAIGTTTGYNLVVVAVDGCSDSYEAGIDSRGVTLQELAQLLQKEGVKYALNLDGGGSANIYLSGASCVIPADRRGLPNCFYERPVPLVFTKT